VEHAGPLQQGLLHPLDELRPEPSDLWWLGLHRAVLGSPNEQERRAALRIECLRRHPGLQGRRDDPYGRVERVGPAAVVELQGQEVELVDKVGW